MADSSDPASISDSAVLEVTGKIMIAGVFVLFVVIAFLFLLHLLARRLWPNNEDPTVVSWRRQLAGQNRPSSRPTGLDGSALQSLPIVVYNPDNSKDPLECAVCLGELQQGEKARFLPKCSHGFHAECIDIWFGSHSTCPICRTNVVSSDPGPDLDLVPGLDSIRVDAASDAAVYPTNVLFWGDDTGVRSAGVAASSGSSSGENGRVKQGLSVDVESGSGQVGSTEEPESPVMTRIKSLKRLLSRGKRVNPHNSCDSSSGSEYVEQV